MSKEKRPRIAIGQLVRSTNEVQQSCIRQLCIAQYYNPNNYTRIKRKVIQSEDEQEKTN
jgi:hypothetical protein